MSGHDLQPLKLSRRDFFKGWGGGYGRLAH